MADGQTFPSAPDTLYQQKVPAAEQPNPPYVQDPDTTLGMDDEGDILTTVNGELQRAMSARTRWMDRQARYYRKRFGIYPKKSFPWAGSANYHLPLIDKSIRKAKPTFVSLLADVIPTASFMSMDAQNLPQEPFLEQEFHWLFWQRMDMFDSVVVGTDLMLGRGFCVVKTFYEKRTRNQKDVWERDEIPAAVAVGIQQGDEQAAVGWLQQIGIPPEEGDVCLQDLRNMIFNRKKRVTFHYTVVEYDAPRVVMRKPEDVVVPSDTKDLDNARFIFDLSLRSGHDLREYAKQGWFRKEVVEQLIEKHGFKAGQKPLTPYNPLIETVRVHEGIDPWQSSADLYRICEAYFYHDVDGDGNDERVVMVYSPDYMQEPLATYLFKRRRWPFQKIYFDEISEDYTAHRGHAELLDPMQTVLKAQHDQKIDRQTMTTALTYKYVPQGMNPGTLRFIPGQGIPVRSMNEFEFVTPPNTDFSFDKEMMQLKAWAEETIGNPDYGNASPLSTTGATPRTAREIGAIGQETQQILSLDAKVFLNCWKKVFERVWEEWVDYGPREFVVRLMGQPPIPVNRTGMVLGEFQITPSGTLWNSNALVNLQKARERLGQFLGNPFVKQYELIQDAFMRDDPRLASQLLVSPQEAQQIQQAMTQQAFAGPAKGKASQPGQNGSNAQMAHVGA